MRACGASVLQGCAAEKALTSSVRVGAKNKKQLEKAGLEEERGWGWGGQYQSGPGQHPAAGKIHLLHWEGENAGDPPSNTGTSTLQRSKAIALVKSPWGHF